MLQRLTTQLFHLYTCLCKRILVTRSPLFKAMSKILTQRHSSLAQDETPASPLFLLAKIMLRIYKFGTSPNFGQVWRNLLHCIESGLKMIQPCRTTQLQVVHGISLITTSKPMSLSLPKPRSAIGDQNL